VLDVKERTLSQIFGSPDDLKFRSSMTLFAAAAADGSGLYRKAIDRHCDSVMDERTLELIGHPPG
jgi:uncharacterized protein (DUF1810 family)